LTQKRKRRNRKVGLPPGSVVYTGDKNAEKLNIEIFDFDDRELVEKDSNQIEDVLKFENEHTATWINVNGLNYVEDITKLGKHYKLHPLLIEEIVNVTQRTKLDEYEHYLFLVCKMPHYKDNELIIEHISFVLGEHFLLSFQEIEGDLFEPIRDRIRNSKGMVRSRGTDYLLFALLDVIVDNYSLLVDEVSQKTEAIEDILLSGSAQENLQADIQELKKEVLRIRKAVYPLKEVSNKLQKMSVLITEKSKIYIGDLSDNITQILENIDLNRELVWGLMDMHLNSLSNKMNEVMKVLTVIATIFIPLTFIAGVYGMNFEFMPELKFKYGYPILMVIMFVTLVVMILLFKRKKWL
jgi:magnesium transporter